MQPPQNGRGWRPTAASRSPLHSTKFAAFPEYTPRERLADGCVHVLSVAASLAAVAALMVIAATWLVILPLMSLAIYGISMIAMFGFSAGYNLVHDPGWKETLRRLDHAAIYVMIAGTYTPFALVAIGGAWGAALMVVVWAVAIIGVGMKLTLPRRFERTSIVLYLVQGWTVLVAIDPLISSVSTLALVLIGAGGVLYTAGVLFHLWRRLPYHNAIWHVFVLAGAACHYAAILDAVALARG